MEHNEADLLYVLIWTWYKFLDPLFDFLELFSHSTVHGYVLWG